MDKANALSKVLRGLIEPKQEGATRDARRPVHASALSPISRAVPKMEMRIYDRKRMRCLDTVPRFY
jgi:hypothetical protein